MAFVEVNLKENDFIEEENNLEFLRLFVWICLSQIIRELMLDARYTSADGS